jgi:hypothetical protein
MFEKLKKKNNNDADIVILKRTEKNVCGGTDATLDKSAPKEIKSENMYLFSVTSALDERYEKSDLHAGETAQINYISAFAAKAENGSFLFIERSDYVRYDEKESEWAFVKDDVFPALVKLVNECELAKSNGYHSTTHGLPQNFGGSVDIRYESGEKISFSDNQAPIITAETAEKIDSVFSDALKGVKVELPDISALREIRFSEKRNDGGYTNAVLTLNSDGTGTNKKEQKFDTPTVYKSEKSVEKETVKDIKSVITDSGILTWAKLPESEFHYGESKTLTFAFDGAEEITVTNDRILPEQLCNAFFEIELEITTKH